MIGRVSNIKQNLNSLWQEQMVWVQVTISNKSEEWHWGWYFSMSVEKALDQRMQGEWEEKKERGEKGWGVAKQ